MSVAEDWFLAEVEPDSEAHAAPKGGKETYCGHPVMFPMGDGAPTCADCVEAVERLDTA